MKITGNTVLITGGSTGIGFALSKALLAKGNVVLVCARTEANLKDAKAQLPDLVTYQCDVTQTEQREKMFEQIAADGYSINILVNNAVMMTDYDLACTDEQAIRKIRKEVNVNFVAPIELIHDVLPKMKHLSGATIVNFNSPQGVVPGARTPVLSATKAALLAYSRCLRQHLLEEKVRVVSVFPPGVDTPTTANSDFKKMSADLFVEKLLAQWEKGQEEIWVGEGKALKIISRVSERFAFYMLNKRIPIVKTSLRSAPAV